MSERLNRYVNSKRVKIRMIELDLTQSNVADQMEVDLATFRRHLAADKPSSFTFIAGLAKVLQTTIEDLSTFLGEDGGPPEAA